MLNGVALVLLALVLPTNPMTCAKRDDLVRHLAERYREVPTAHGLSQDGVLLEILASRDGESWTAVATFTDGTSCLVASGYFWEAAPQIERSPHGSI